MIPRVTVVIALYNKANFITTTIASVLAQSYTQFKLVVVDDGSTDGSRQRVEQFTDDRLTLLTIKNAGPGVARNTGLAIADTPYVTFIDADDAWHPDYLQEAIGTLEKHPACDLWLCAAIWQPEGQYRLPFLSREPHQSGEWSLEVDYTPIETTDVLNFFATGAVVAKTEIIKKYHGYFDLVRCTSGEDGYLWLQVMYNHRVYREAKALLIIHTEGSDLGIGRRSHKPVPPWLSYPQPILDHCPAAYQKALLSYLDLSAFFAFRREVYQGKVGTAIGLLWRYPNLAHHRGDYLPVGIALIWYTFKHYVRLLLKK